MTLNQHPDFPNVLDIARAAAYGEPQVMHRQDGRFLLFISFHFLRDDTSLHLHTVRVSNFERDLNARIGQLWFAQQQAFRRWPHFDFDGTLLLTDEFAPLVVLSGRGDHERVAANYLIRRGEVTDSPRSVLDTLRGAPVLEDDVLFARNAQSRIPDFSEDE